MAASGNDRVPGRSYPRRVALRCLIVDDDPRFLRAARSLLEQECVQVVGLATTGAEAVRCATDLHPDVTLVDIDLGEESGFEVACRLAGNPHADPGHLILISAHTEDDFTDLIAESLAIGFLEKPMLSAVAIERLIPVAPGA